MKKYLVAVASLVLVVSFSTAVLAATVTSTQPAKITKLLVLAEDEPAPTPPSEPPTEPAPTPPPEEPK